jgi:hypothetical protein
MGPDHGVPAAGPIFERSLVLASIKRLPQPLTMAENAPIAAHKASDSRIQIPTALLTE